MKGKIEFEENEVDVNELPSLKTKIMMNLANPAAAFTQRYPHLNFE